MRFCEKRVNRRRCILPPNSVKFSSGIVEGLNNKASLTTGKSYGFRTYHAAETALYHALGALPVPETAHEFF
ncbi:transposase [Kineobactrum salinum]|uniref:Transposase n=1 Tax=Kineobactrum salinum TaxID=2708301 RepID=A0A6C0U5P2_9GAMM|nr:transposase [Kineobactrum salinum]